MMMKNSIKIINRVKKYILHNNMISPGDIILVALSGGADSVCLLHILKSLSQELSIKLFAAHLNHGLRYDEAERDCEFSVNLCNQMGIEIFVKKVEVEELAKKSQISIETAGRQARYNFFDEVRHVCDANKIATAHNKNDNAETIIMHFLRGSGTDGLSGIDPVRKNGIIRPILDLSREEIEQYLKSNNMQYVTDSTNYTTEYHRNKIRLELIDILKDYNPNIITTLTANANLLKYDSKFLDNIAKETADKTLVVLDNEVKVNINKLVVLNPAILSRVIKEAIYSISGTKQDISAILINRVCELVYKGKTGQTEDLLKKIVAKRTYKEIIICKNQMVSSKNEFCYKLNIGDCLYIPETGHTFLTEVTDNKLVKNTKDCVFFDYNLIKGQIYIRSKKQGDKFIPTGMKGHKKLKDFFIDEKIDRDLRLKIPILATKENVLWVCGYRVDKRFLPNIKTNKFLMIRFSKQ